jgi:hypothetical protein
LSWSSTVEAMTMPFVQ